MYQLLLAAQSESDLKVSKDLQKSKSSVKRVFKKIKSMVGSDKSTSNIQLYKPDIVEKLTLEILDFDAHVFERFMRYVHCGTLSVNVDNVVGKFQV